MDQFIDQDRQLEIKKQQMAAAAYFFKKTDQYIAFEKVKSKTSSKLNNLKLSYNFHKVISLSVPSLPPSLQKSISPNSAENKSRKESDRIQVFVQLLSCPETSSCLSMDVSNNCISLTNPTPSRKFTASNAPKLFPVDAVITEDCPIMEICSNSLGAVIRAVANGEDACVISFGNVPPSDLNTIIGFDKSPTSIGVMPCAILWLFNYIKTIRKQEYARFSVRISAAEISGKHESCRDLLLSISNPSSDNQPSDPSSSAFNSLVELRAVNVEKAAYYLDYALTERSKSEENGLSHLFVTLHLYQYHLQNDSGISGGRSKLHMIDLGCGRLSEDQESTALSIQGISKVIYALWSHQRYIPNPDSILAQNLKRIIVHSYRMMQTSMIIKVSGKETQYNEALQVVQLASKLYRQKMRSTKLSSSFCSDDNSSSSDSFSIRRMTKFTHQYGHDSRRFDRSTNTLNISSDIDATSSSEVSCDTVIYRGHPLHSPPSKMRGNGDGSSQGQLAIPMSDNEDKKPEQKLTLFQMKRRCSNKTNSNAWPKVAVKKAKEVMKSGQELWVDGPQAFCSSTEMKSANNNISVSGIMSKVKDANEQEKITTVFDVINEKEELKDNSMQIVSSKITCKNAYNAETQANKLDHYGKPKHAAEKSNNENAIKSKMVTDWLRNQPKLQEGTEETNLVSTHINNKGNKNDKEKGIPTALSQRTKSQKHQTEPIQIEHKLNTTNFSRIEDWIRTVSIESPKRTASPADCGVVMTQSLYSSNCSHYPSSELRFNSYSNVPLSPPSAPLNYSNSTNDQNANCSRGNSVPPGSIGSEIENECSRLWFYTPVINDRNLMPFVDTVDDSNNNRIPSFSGTPLGGINQLDSLRNSSFRNTPNVSNCQSPLVQYDPNLMSNHMTYNVQKYSTLPSDIHSPKHNHLKHSSANRNTDQNDGSKTNEISTIPQSSDFPLKLNPDNKRSQKETKKKETKKGFGFLNHLIRNKKLKKELSLNRPTKEEHVPTENNSQTAVKSHDFNYTESIDYVKRAGPPLVLSSPYHMITQPKPSTGGADSSGHGSDCSSFKEVKSTQVSVNFQQETAGYKFLSYRRAGSSGYESVVRDSELSSHNDSASECSVPTNIVLQTKVPIHQIPVSTSATTAPVASVASDHNTTLTETNEHENQIDSEHFLKESQKVFELIKSEKLCLLEQEQDEIKNELINVLKYFNDDVDDSRKFLESHLSDIEGGEELKSSELLNATNQTLRLVLNRYQSNLTMITSFVGQPF